MASNAFAPVDPPTEAFAYLRVSGKAQEDGDGFDRQRAAISRFAQANGIIIIKWFEEVQTGKDRWEDRKAWSDMIGTLNGVRTIVVEKMDRVAREVLISEMILNDLRKRKVTLLTSSGEDSSDDSPERVMFRQMLSVFAAYERSCITLKLRGARRRMKEATGRCEGRKPFNDPATLEVMCCLRTRGDSYDDIAATLNHAGYPTKLGKRWVGQVVCKILHREGFGGDARNIKAALAGKGVSK